MTRFISLPSTGQLAPLLTAYSQAAAAKRRQLVLGVARRRDRAGDFGDWGRGPSGHLVEQVGNFTSYFDRLLKLDTGMRVWTDPQEWFWGLPRWCRLLGETVLIAYVATLTGAVAAFIGAFWNFAAASRISSLR